MRAALLHAPGSLEVSTLPRPDCPEGGLLIKVEACSVCASDVKMVRLGHRDLLYPRILGHEVAGKIVESSAEGGSLEVGDRVQVWPGMACGDCPQCLRGHDNQCSSIGILGFNRDGGFAELMAVPGECVSSGGVNRLDDGMPSDLATLAEPLACCMNAQESLGVGFGDNVLIVGGGPLGALHALLARHHRASMVTVMERESRRRKMLSPTGADQVIEPPEPDAWGAALDLTSGQGFDKIILAASEVQVDDRLLGILAPRGQLCLFSGLPKDRATATVDLNQLHYMERRVVGSYGCRSADCRQALRLLTDGGIEASWLISGRFGLDSIHEALRHAESKEGMKATITRF
jgi:L-iditol 2-dehydrogenase